MVEEIYTEISNLINQLEPSSKNWGDFQYIDINTTYENEPKIISAVRFSDTHRLEGGLSIALDNQSYVTFYGNGSLEENSEINEGYIRKAIIPALKYTVENQEAVQAKISDFYQEKEANKIMAYELFSKSELKSREEKLSQLEHLSNQNPPYQQGLTDLTLETFINAANIVEQTISPKAELKEKASDFFTCQIESYTLNEQLDSTINMKKYSEKAGGNYAEIIMGTTLRLVESDDNQYKLMVSQRYNGNLPEDAELYLKASEALIKAGFPVELDQHIKNVYLGNYEIKS